MDLDCTLHEIQNVIKASNKDTDGVKKTMTKARKLIKFIKKSNLAANELKLACARTGHQYKKLKTCTEIRWNSEHDAFEMLLYHHECLEHMDRNRDLDSVSEYVFNRDEWRQLQAAVEILKPVKVIIRDVNMPRLAKAYAKNLKNNMASKFPKYGMDEKLIAYGNFLDPHLKGIHLEQENMLDDVIDSIKKMTKDVVTGRDVNRVIDLLEESENEDNLSATEKL